MRKFKYLDRVTVIKPGHGFENQSGIVTHGANAMGEVQVSLDGHEAPIVIKAEGLEAEKPKEPVQHIFMVMGYNQWNNLITMSSEAFPSKTAAQLHANRLGKVWKAFVVGTDLK